MRNAWMKQSQNSTSQEPGIFLQDQEHLLNSQMTLYIKPTYSHFRILSAAQNQLCNIVNSLLLKPHLKMLKKIKGDD